jgi:hypothetical protein
VRQIIRKLSIIGCIVSLIWVTTNFTHYWFEKQAKISLIKQLAQKEIAYAATQINSIIKTPPKLSRLDSFQLSPIETNQIRELFTSLSLGKTGYGYLVAQDGTFLYHPLKEFYENRKNVFKRAEELNNKTIQEIAERGIRGEKGVLTLLDSDINQYTWIFYYPLTKIGGFVALSVYQQEVLPITEQVKQQELNLSLSLLVFGFFLIVISTRIWQGKLKSLWILSLSVSLLLAAEISYIWHYSLNESAYRSADNVEIDDHIRLQSFLDQYTKIKADQTQKTPLYIPTGIFIRTIKFEEANNIFITGNLWQKYPLNLGKDIQKGFTMPEAITATDLGRWTEIYHYQNDQEEVIGWYFEVTLRQSFDYSKYPFDSKDIRIRLLPQEVNRNVVLIPDLPSYTDLLPQSNPGLEENIVLPGWNIKRSFFEYQLKSYKTNFGINTYIPEDEVPELYFTVIATRNFLTVFISNFMPILVVSIMMFSIQLIISQKVQEEETRKFTALEIISVGGGLIFIVLLDQVNLRGSIVTASLIYIEYIYFVLYLIIILITVNALLIALGNKIWLIYYQDNLIPKLLYWPTFIFLLLLMTLISFY